MFVHQSHKSIHSLQQQKHQHADKTCDIHMSSCSVKQGKCREPYSFNASATHVAIELALVLRAFGKKTAIQDQCTLRVNIARYTIVLYSTEFLNLHPMHLKFCFKNDRFRVLFYLPNSLVSLRILMTNFSILSDITTRRRLIVKNFTG